MKVVFNEEKFLSSSKKLQNTMVGVADLFIKRKKYTIYAIQIFEDLVLFAVCDQIHPNIPYCYPSEFFDVVENKISRYWFGSSCRRDKKNYLNFSFKEWATEDFFYNNLVIEDYCEREHTLFRYYKEKMDLEFPDDSVLETAEVGDEKWLICPVCIDAWENFNYMDAMVKCPVCQKIYHNPRYNENWFIDEN